MMAEDVVVTRQTPEPTLQHRGPKMMAEEDDVVIQRHRPTPTIFFFEGQGGGCWCSRLLKNQCWRSRLSKGLFFVIATGSWVVEAPIYFVKSSKVMTEVRNEVVIQ